MDEESKYKIVLKKDKNLSCLLNLGNSGLVNIGNTCFMNTALQCLNSVNVFCAYFLSDQYKEDINKKKESEFVEIYSNFLKNFWSENCIIRPQNFKRTFGNFYDPYSSFRQNDAAECFSKIIELLHEGLCYQVNIDIVIDNKKDLSEIDKINLLAIESWKRQYSNNYSIPLKLFYGQFWSRIRCIKCNTISHNFDPFGIINLPISEKTNTLDDCIEYYTLTENMEGRNKYNCSHCKQETIAKKRITIWKLPPILTFSFNRFSGDKKINKYIDFPINKANFSNLVEKQIDKKAIYDLMAIANHSGGLSGGHYWAYTRGTNGKWYNCNDDDITEILNESSIISNTAYFLVYKRRGITADIVIS